MGKQKNMPDIRFKSFSEKWEERMLGEIAPLRGGFAFQSARFCKKGIPIIKISNILPTGEVGGEFSFYKEQTHDENYLLPNQSALLAMSGATTGKVSILNSSFKKVYQNQRVGYFEGKNTVDYLFISTLVRSHLFANKLKSVLVAGAQPNVSSKEIDSFEFNIPQNTEEQQKIGNFFQQLDSLITLHQQKYDKLLNIKKAMLEKMFPKKGVDVPEIRFKGFSGEWAERKLGEIGHTTIGEFVIRTKQNPNGKYPVFNGGKSHTGLYDEYNNEGNKIIISARGANAGHVNIQKERFWAGNSCYSIGIKDHRKFYTLFVFYVIKKNQRKFTNFQQSANIPSVSKNDVEVFQIPTPNIEEQTKIGNFFQQLDTLISLHKEKHDKLLNIKKACLEKMFV